MKDYLGFGNRSAKTPQTEPLPGMIKNNSGTGYSYSVDDMKRFKRWLLLGSSDGTFYVQSRKLTKENLDALERLLQAGKGLEVVQMLVEVSQKGKAPSNDPALFALARCTACDTHGMIDVAEEEKTYTFEDPEHRFHIPDNGSLVKKNRTYIRSGDTVVLTTKVQKGKRIHPADMEVRKAAFLALPHVARTGTHILHFISYVEEFRGWGSGLAKAVASWYQNKSDERLAYQVVKYKQRDNWSQRDALRLTHPKPATDARKLLYHWITKGCDTEEYKKDIFEQHSLIRAVEELATHPLDYAADLIHVFHVPHEAIASHLKKERDIWAALFEDMPMEAMIRNIPTMTRVELLKPLEEHTRTLVQRLHDKERLKKARIHPMKVLIALKTYESGKNVRGDGRWVPVAEIVQALHDAFYLCFENIEPIQKRVLISVDVSGSMRTGSVGGIVGLSPQLAGAAMAMVLARSCHYQTASGFVLPNYEFLGFDTQTYRFTFTEQQRLDDIMRGMHLYGGGGTDCGLPLKYALQEKREFDAFVTLTDNETFFGSTHVCQTLDHYRKEINSSARYVNIQMTATHVTNNRPDDLLALEVCGFDTSVPEIISGFLAEDV